MNRAAKKAKKAQRKADRKNIHESDEAENSELEPTDAARPAPVEDATTESR